MDGTVSELYQKLLEQEAANISFEEVDSIVALFESKALAVQMPDFAIEPDTLANASNLRRLLDHPEKLTDRQLLIALAALRYFVRDEDHDPNGLNDDSLVLQAAVAELQEAISTLLN